MPSPGMNWIAGAVRIESREESIDVPKDHVTAMVTAVETRTVVVLATNPGDETATVRLELQPDPVGPHGVKVSARSLVLHAQESAEITIETQGSVLLSVRLHSDLPVVPGGELLCRRTWLWDSRVNSRALLLADSQALVLFVLPVSLPSEQVAGPVDVDRRAVRPE